MRILRVITSVDKSKGGPINGLCNSSFALRERGHVVDVATVSDGALPPEEINNCFFFNAMLGKLCFSPAMFFWLLRNVKEYDVVLVHGIWQLHGFLVLLACCIRRKPYCVFVHGMLDPWFRNRSVRDFILKQLFWVFFDCHVVRCAKSVLFTSQEECNLAVRSYVPSFSNAVVVKYGARDLSKVAVSNGIMFQKGMRKNFLFLSRVHPKKGVDILIEAFSKVCESVPDYDLFIAGPVDPDYKAVLVELTEKLGVFDRVRWLGMLSLQEKTEALVQADVMILPSHQENFGIVVAESLSLSVPVIVTDNVNIWADISKYKAGFVCETHINSVFDSLMNWINKSSDERRIYRKNARACYDEMYTMEVAADSLEQVFFIVDSYQRRSL